MHQHIALVTVELLHCETPQFISPRRVASQQSWPRPGWLLHL